MVETSKGHRHRIYSRFVTKIGIMETKVTYTNMSNIIDILKELKDIFKDSWGRINNIKIEKNT